MRNHTVTPTIDRDTWRLRVFGSGLSRPRAESDALSLSYADLRALPVTRVTATHECTGNGRSFFATQQGTPASGTAWTLGAVGAVSWEGVRLADVLRRVGIRPEAVSIQAAGLDPNYVSGGVDYGPVRRPFPVAKALDDALLAWGMNGEPLLPDHGYPVRLVLPGWVGIASIKWLGPSRSSDTELTSPVEHEVVPHDRRRLPRRQPAADRQPGAVRLGAGLERVGPGGQEGRAHRTLLERCRADPRCRGLHRRRRHLGGRRDLPPRPARGVDAVAVSPGCARRRAQHTLMARATDAAGRTQPLVTPYNDNGYFFDAVVRHPVTVT